ncbi:MOSC domain-containing protein [Evansella tamaricis]|uniref:MOSC domain-containing protein n=1 Tax=Evansella tamaricis TaxID=2069301 RepID=A0ABS6JCL5_9BACI|nr:MOSC domain-containing protein [Evansella tamaricis]MBU9711417.1 MOSC domain-containing protein [Evansella tamaricis]
MKRLKANIIAVNVGKPQLLENFGQTITSAINKETVEGDVFLSRYNLDGDEQADKKHHGGEDKAICVYPFDHYPFWEEELGIKLTPGAFGENLTVKGLVENAVCLGDVFKWGEAVVQVSQPRMPCHKVAKRFGIAELPQRIIETGFTGFYMRVLKEGMVSSTEPLQFIKRFSEIPISFVNSVFYQDQYNEKAVMEILEVEELAFSWRKMLEKQRKKALK